MKKTGWVVLMLALMLALAGCGDKPQASAPEESNATNNGIMVPGAADPDSASADDQEANHAETNDEEKQDAPEHKDPVNSESEKQTSKIKVYLTDNNIDQLTAVEREITYSTDIDKYNAAFQALQTEEPGQLSLWKKVILRQIKLQDGLLTVDITLPDEARLGAGGEMLAIDALLETYFQFDEVKQLELTVDGEKVESLMGHVELNYPYTRENR